MTCQIDDYTQFIKFLCVGMLNTLFGYGLFSLFIYFNLHYVSACLLTTCIGIFFNFSTFGNLVFEKHHYSLMPRFIAVYIFTFFLSITAIKIANQVIDNLYVNGGISIFITTPIIYFLHKHFVFKRMPV